jgi:drug/metabolite transporter (DMT)-like permease
LLFYKSWIVFVYAVALSIESIIIEYLTTYFIKFSPIVISSVSITLSGIMLLFVTTIILKKYKETMILFVKSWSNLIAASLSLSLGIFAWYDSINRIGASKEALIAGPIEIIIIIILARIFLSERLSRFHILGIFLGFIGFILALVSDLDISNVANNVDIFNMTIAIVTTPTSTSWLSIISFGDIEAILSALGFALAVLFLSKLILKHSPIQVAGASMFIAGLILTIFMIFGLFYNPLLLSSNKTSSILEQPSTLSIYINIMILLLFSLIPFIGSLSYSIGLRRIGASLTATIGSSNIVITLIIQIILKELGFASHLPVNIFLAILGSIIGFFGIFIIHMSDFLLLKNKRQ